MVRTQIQLTEQQSEELRKRAKDQGISVAEVIRRSIDETLCRPHITDEMRRRAKAAVGFVNSGTGDLAEKHNEYFAEAILEHIR